MRRGAKTYDQRQDTEADYFARALLMPEHMIEPEFKKIRGKKGIQDAISELASIFHVEQVHVTLRLRELKWI